MEVVKCINKLYDANGIIKTYVIKYSTGYIRSVPEASLKDLIRSGRLTVSNLELTPSDILINKNPEDNIDYKHINSKLMLMGVRPSIDESSGYVIGAPNKFNVFTDIHNQFSQQIREYNKTAKFVGKNELVNVYNNLYIRLDFGKIIVENPNIINYLSKNTNEKIILTAPDIELNYKGLNDCTPNKIYNILRNQHEIAYVSVSNILNTRTNLFKIRINLEKAGLTTDELYEITEKHIKRLRLKNLKYKVAYDILTMQEFVYSMYLSTDKHDQRYKKLFIDLDNKLHDYMLFIDLSKRLNTEAYKIVSVTNYILMQYYPEMKKEFNKED